MEYDNDEFVSGKLRSLIEDIKYREGLSLVDLTVLSNSNDPYRMDVKAKHRDGKWFGDALRLVSDDEAPIHNRGAHYRIVSVDGGIKKPNGEIYRNSDDDWCWLEDHASSAGRWLGYVAWDKIFDARASAPEIYEHQRPALSCEIALDAFVPDVIEPEFNVLGTSRLQQYHLVFFAEKTSLGSVLKPLADRYGADLYLCTGEISNSHLAHMAKQGAKDGRPMVVFVFADCDPAGYQMTVSIAHKLRAFRDGFYPDLEFRIIPGALTVEQVERLGLPSTPLKETERRADGWRRRYGVEQTEIDALAALRPEVLREIVAELVAPYFDSSLSSRTWHWKNRIQEFADELLAEKTEEPSTAEAIQTAERARVRYAEAVQAVESLMEEIGDSINDAIADEFPDESMPEPDLPWLPDNDAIVTSETSLLEHIKTLRARKDYSDSAPLEYDAA